MKKAKRSRAAKVVPVRRKPADLRVRWAKRARALLYFGPPATGGWLSHVLESVSLPHEGRTLVAELEARGYDLTTLRFQIRKKATR